MSGPIAYKQRVVGSGIGSGVGGKGRRGFGAGSVCTEMDLHFSFHWSVFCLRTRSGFFARDGGGGVCVSGVRNWGIFLPTRSRKGN